MREELALLPGYLTAHLELTLLALLLATLLSVPLGVYAARRARLEASLLVAASIIQTIPSLALLALMVPLLAALHLPSIGHLPAFIALVLYAVLPILRNTVLGLRGVDHAVLEAARAVGMTPRESLWRVELPLALPLLVGGVRTATAWTVGLATLSTPVGGVSLGNYIFSGLQTRNYDSVWVGCISAALLALLLDGLLRALQSGVERRSRRRAALGLVGFALLYAVVGLSLVSSAWARAPRPLFVGAKTFSEQYVLSELIARTLERATPRRTQILHSLGSTLAFDALRNGQIDCYVDYSGTLWSSVLARREAAPSREHVLAEVTSELRARYDVEVVGPLGFENAYALAMRRERAAELHITSIQDLAAHPELSLGADYEFLRRPEWRALRDAYRLNPTNQRSMDPSLMYQALVQGEVDVVSAFSSDGRIQSFDLVLLADPRAALPPYDALLLARASLRRDDARAYRALESLVGRITPDQMRQMNQLVDQAHWSPARVAEDYMARHPAPVK